jgi:7,8-dihydropterin-6-yl-methyl-4-(beta-D-ribofuranosyl)aminobenzene 5'-phosphate synthase
MRKGMLLVLLAALPAAALGTAPDSVRGPEGAGSSIKLTILYDNYAYAEDLTTSWGFACLIEGLEQVILFDTGGYSPTLLSNMERLGIDPATIDAVVLSHDHRDHTGGLDGFLAANGDVTVYLLGSFPPTTKSLPQSRAAEVIEVTGAVQICPGAVSTGELQGPSRIPEQSLVVTSEAGPVVVTGCAHPGIVRIVERATELQGQAPVAVLGGFHLLREREETVREIAETLRALGVQYAAPSHCSGDRTLELFEEAFGEQYLKCGAGRVFRPEDFGGAP